MRCLYCHNPDTWNPADGTEMTADEIIEKFERNRSFYTTGGITATGGEPMLQLAFLTELFTKAKARDIHTCLDTSGIMFPAEAYREAETSCVAEVSHTAETNCAAEMGGTASRLVQIDRLMKVTDLVMLDIKHIDASAHKSLTGHSNQNSLAFARYLCEKQKPVWIRHVVVPGITFDRRELTELGHFLKTLPNMEKLEVLPYHAMGKVKYDNLGLDYVLKETPQLTKEEAAAAEQIIREAMK
jgi:pyruvate formate lyase activating enzyme